MNKQHICDQCGALVRLDWMIHYHKMGCSDRVYYKDGVYWREWTKGVDYTPQYYQGG